MKFCCILVINSSNYPCSRAGCRRENLSVHQYSIESVLRRTNQEVGGGVGATFETHALQVLEMLQKVP